MPECFREIELKDISALRLYSSNLHGKAMKCSTSNTKNGEQESFSWNVLVLVLARVWGDCTALVKSGVQSLKQVCLRLS